ncbi:hypothetical protein [Streptosporangium sp. CA-115845]|uniref:hypothetical protein n=1 Tax=Streptosporangium sp. CA-115845 TaxID=3240071 RepID=UPI003D8A36FA
MRVAVCRDSGLPRVRLPAGYRFAAAFSPDGRTVTTGRLDGFVVLWDLTELVDLRAHARERACAISDGGLSRVDWFRYVGALPYFDTCAA